jgi:hypothetical protein
MVIELPVLWLLEMAFVLVLVLVIVLIILSA